MFGGRKMKRFIKMFSSLMLALMIAVSAVIIPSSAASVKLSKKSITLITGTSTTLKLTGTKKTVKWSSMADDVATVSSKGKVTAKSTGLTYIVAKVGKTSYKCKVKVINGKITVGKSEVSLKSNETVKVKIKALGGHSIAAESMNENIVTVSFKGSKWKGNIINIKIKGVYAGETAVKVYSKKYPKSIYKYIDVNVESVKENEFANVASVSMDSASENESDNATDGMSFAEEVLYYCNIEREKAGVSPLVLDDTLCSAAAVRAEEITGSFEHTRPDGRKCFTAMDDIGYSYSAAGENIAWGYRTAEEVVDGWMNSAGHRANILSSNFNRLGVGKSGTYWVQMFAYSN